jgi:hypothetical protein
MSKYEGEGFKDGSEPPVEEEPMGLTLDQGFTVQDLEAALDLGERMGQPHPPQDGEFWDGVNDG